MDIAIKSKNTSLDFIFSIIFLFLIYFDMNSSGGSYWKLLVISIMFLTVCFKHKALKVSKILGIYFVFYILNIASGLYGLTNEYFIGNFAILTSMFMIMLSFPTLLNTKEKINNFMKFIILFGVILSIYSISLTDVSRLMNGIYFAENILLERIGNRNDVAMAIGLAFNFSLYFFLHKKKRINVFIMLIMFIAILLTGSRKGLLFSVTPFFINLIYIFITTKKIKKRFRYIILSIILILLVYYALFHIEFMYNNIGFRIENAVRSIVLNQETTESSLNSRGNMIDSGLRYFKEKPLIGYGLENFRVLYGHETGLETYSHNNFVELLVNNGLIGFISYYLFYILIIINNFNKLKNSKLSDEKDYRAFLISLLISILIIDFTMISYKWYPLYIIFSLSLVTFESHIDYDKQ